MRNRTSDFRARKHGRIRKIASHFENGVEGAGQEADFDAVRVEMKLTGAAHKLFEQEGYARISEAREPPRPTPEKRGGCEVDRRCNLRRQKSRRAVDSRSPPKRWDLQGAVLREDRRGWYERVERRESRDAADGMKTLQRKYRPRVRHQVEFVVLHGQGTSDSYRKGYEKRFERSEARISQQRGETEVLHRTNEKKQTRTVGVECVKSLMTGA